MGFTMLRKHIKVEPLRWYHHCDRLGMLVWQVAGHGGRRHHHAVVTAPAFGPLRLDDRRYRLFGRAVSISWTIAASEVAVASPSGPSPWSSRLTWRYGSPLSSSRVRPRSSSPTPD